MSKHSLATVILKTSFVIAFGIFVLAMSVFALIATIRDSITVYYNNTNLPNADPSSDVPLTTDWNDRADDLLHVIVIMPSVSSTLENSGQLIIEPA